MGPRSRVCLVAAVVVGPAGVAVGFLHPGHRHGAAALAAPRLAALLHRYPRDDESGHGVSPPQPEQGVRAESDEQGCREVGAQHVLLPLALGRGRSQLLPYAPLQHISQWLGSWAIASMLEIT